MINEVMIKGDRIGKSPCRTSADNDPYKNLASLISHLAQCSEKFCIVIKVVDSPSLANYTPLNNELRSTTKSFTKRELQICELAIKGLSNRMISEKLFISIETVKSHRKNIVCKAGVRKIEEIKNILLNAIYS